jgi:hypothetical protein
MESHALITESLVPCRNRHRTPTYMHNRSCLIRVSVLVTVLYFLLTGLAGCRQPRQPVSYEDLCGLSSEQMGVMGEEDVRQWIEEKYNNVPVKSQEVIGGESIVIYVWQYDEITGNAYLRDGHLFRVSLHNIENGSMLGQVVAGLGPPEMLDRSYLTYEQILYTIGLDYPALGVSVDTSDYEDWDNLAQEGRPVVLLTEHMRVDDVHCYRSGSMEEILREVFFLSPENVSYHMQRRMPWPGFGALVPLDY